SLKDVSNSLNLSSKRNAELNVGRFLRIMLAMVGGGIWASLDVVIVAMVKGVIIGVGVSSPFSSSLSSSSSSSSLSLLASDLTVSSESLSLPSSLSSLDSFPSS
nr:hypothetical protein [Tanacetum cinerariifolium]